MKKISFFPFLCLLLMLSCGPSNPDLENATVVKDRSEQQIVTGDKPSDNLKANAIDDGDTAGKIRWSLGRIQEEMRNSIGAIAGLESVDVLLDDNFQMVLRTKENGDTYERRVGIANIDIDMKNIQIIRDGDEYPNPGFRMPILADKAGVEIYKNGSKTETKRELEIILGERRQVQLVVSALTHAVRSARGESL